MDKQAFKVAGPLIEELNLHGSVTIPEGEGNELLFKYTNSFLDDGVYDLIVGVIPLCNADDIVTLPPVLKRKTACDFTVIMGDLAVASPLAQEIVFLAKGRFVKVGSLVDFQRWFAGERGWFSEQL